MNISCKSALMIALVLLCLIVRAQTVKPLKVGDKVPNILLEKMLNHRTKRGNLSDFKGKAIIIDQWFISCAPCVSAMPHLDSLQKEFDSELQILPVTFEKGKDVEKFWSEHIVAKGLKFTQVIEDTLVRSYFPAVTFPQQVWIDKSGIVVAITDGNSTTKSNVKKFIKGEKLSLDLKQDELDMNVRMATEPNILVRYHENKDKLQFYSYVSKYRKEFAGMFSSKLDTASQLVRVIGNNLTLNFLYSTAYTNNSWETINMATRFIRKDNSPIKSNYDSVADTVNFFCYELMYRDSTIKNFKNYMIPDLDRFFRLKSHEETLDVPCYVISPNQKGKRYLDIYQPDRESYYNFSPTLAKKIVINNNWIWMLEKVLNDYTDLPLLFELEGARKANFDVRWSFDDLNKMNEDLEKFDLKIEKKIRKRKVIILEDADN